MIITEKMVKKALELAGPSIDNVLSDPKMTLGSKFLAIIVSVPGLALIRLRHGCHKHKGRNMREYEHIAQKKLDVVLREQASTSEIIATRPWSLLDREYLYAGGAIRHGIAVATSGAKGWVDEAISEIIISMIVMLAQLEIEDRLERKQKQI